MSRLKELACAVKNEARALGLHRIGLPCQLMGTGMAFPWTSIATAKLATGQIVEDLQLGIELTRAGSAPLLCPAALVTSELPAAAEGLEAQRARWEHGHMAAIVREGPSLFLGSLRRGDWAAVALAADLMVPPLALLLLLARSPRTGSQARCIYVTAGAMGPAAPRAAPRCAAALRSRCSWPGAATGGRPYRCAGSYWRRSMRSARRPCTCAFSELGSSNGCDRAATTSATSHILPQPARRRSCRVRIGGSRSLATVRTR